MIFHNWIYFCKSIIFIIIVSIVFLIPRLQLMIQFLTYFIAIFLLAFSISTKTKLLPGATEKILNKIHILFS